VKVELSAARFDGRVENLVRLEERVVEKLRAEILVKPKVELSAPGALPGQRGKASACSMSASSDSCGTSAPSQPADTI